MIIVLTSNFLRQTIFFSSRYLHQFLIHNEKKSHKKKCVIVFCYTIFSQKTVNSSSFVFTACQITGFVLQQGKNEDTLVQNLKSLKSCKNKIEANTL